MTPDPLNELERFYDACQTAPTPPLEVPPPRGVWLANLRWSLAGIGLGVAIAVAIVVTIPAPDAEAGRQAAESISRMQMAGVEPAPVGRPRASMGGTNDA